MAASLLPPPGITAMVMVAPGYVSGDTSNDVDMERPRPTRTTAPSAGLKESQYAPGTSAAPAPTQTQAETVQGSSPPSAQPEIRLLSRALILVDLTGFPSPTDAIKALEALIDKNKNKNKNNGIGFLFKEVVVLRVQIKTVEESK